MEEEIRLTKAEAAEIFAQWWKDFLSDKTSFGTEADIDGKASADTLFEYASKYQ